MLLLVARQKSVPTKSLTRNYVTGFLWIRAVTIAMQRFDKRSVNNMATVFRGVRPDRPEHGTDTLATTKTECNAL
jgi:hypothetical protein